MRQKELGWHFEYTYYDCNYLVTWLDSSIPNKSDFFSLSSQTESSQGHNIWAHWAKEFALAYNAIESPGQQWPSHSIWLPPHAFEEITDKKEFPEIKNAAISHHTVLISNHKSAILWHTQVYQTPIRFSWSIEWWMKEHEVTIQEQRVKSTAVLSTLQYKC